ncbi:MAG: helix-turn-helix domain-containing protein [Thermodesulfobacteriota bacterium]|jgi:excisionase family DNA binding protein
MVYSELLTVDQVAEYLNIKASTLYSKIHEIEHFRLGRLIRFRREDIETWLEKSKVTLVDPEKRAKRILRGTPASRNEDIQRIIRKSIDRVKAAEYNPTNGKTEPSRGPQKGGS